VAATGTPDAITRQRTDEQGPAVHERDGRADESAAALSPSTRRAQERLRRRHPPVRRGRCDGDPPLVERPPPENSFTAEFLLFNDSDEPVSFGAANPVRATYYTADQQHFVCRLGPLPLTEGVYSFNFTVRVWNQVRWDFWERAIGFEIQRCDLFNTGHGVSNVHDGDFVMQQEWMAGED
jgi:hypothetical protein